jgi:hypothetical protein
MRSTYKLIAILLFMLFTCVTVFAQVSLTSSGVPYTQDFNSLASTGTSSTVPTGWAFIESGTSARNDGNYTANNGSSNAGDTYSYGASSSTDRAFGGLLSNTLNYVIGASFTNNIGSTIRSLTISYTGEQWRAGATDRGAADRLDFQYSTDATSLSTGTWMDVDQLDFNSPNINTTLGALDGNAAENRSNISFTITGLNITNGTTFWIRWNDFNISSSDDGLAVDDFSLTPFTNSYDIYMVNIKTGSIERVTFINGDDEYNPSFNNNGKFIAHDVVSGSDPLGQSIYITDLATHTSTPLAGAEGGNDASWSPNGKYIAFDRNFNLYVVSAGGGTATLVRENAVDAEWSNNSKRLAFTDITDGSLRTVDVSGGSEIIVTNFGINASWSPDGKYIAYSDGNNIFTIAVNEAGEPEGTPVQLTSDGPNTNNQQPSWSNDGKTIVFQKASGNLDIWTISSSGGTQQKLTGLPDYGDYDPCYSKNGKYVAYAGFTLAASPKHSVNNKVSAAISENSLPTVYVLEQNFPNPFNPSTVIRYALPENANVNLVIYDILGREVAELINGEAGAGYHEVKFDGSKLSSGIYFYKLTAGNFIQIKKMLLMK